VLLGNLRGEVQADKKCMIRYLIYIGIMCFIFSCNNNSNKEREEKAFSMNEISRTVDDLEKVIENNGSVEAYNDYGIAYLDDKHFGDYYKMSKIMADKYNHIPAYYKVFFTIIDRKNDYYTKDIYSLEGLSKDKRNEAIKYLELGAQKGDEQCKRRIEEYQLEGRYFTKK
jgi:hypothetical protein